MHIYSVRSTDAHGCSRSFNDGLTSTGTGLENPSPCSTYSSVLLSSSPSSLAFKHAFPHFPAKLRLSTQSRHTLSILETTRGFLTKAIRASVLGEQGTPASPHCSRSQEWHRVAEKTQEGLERNPVPRLLHLAWVSGGYSWYSRGC